MVLAAFTYAAVSVLAASDSSSSSSSGISLSDFTPGVDKLPTACQNVYVETIPGCQASDFAKNTRCSSNCVNGLLQISQQVNSQCSNANVADTSIIGFFLRGQGIPALCVGVDVTTISASSTQAQTSQAASSSKAAGTSTKTSTSVSTAAASSSSSDGIMVDTSQSPTPVSSATITSELIGTGRMTAATQTSSTKPAFGISTSSSTTTKSSAKASSTDNGQKSNSDSGGGSPFDVQSTGLASTPYLSPIRAILAAAILGFAITLC